MGTVVKEGGLFKLPTWSKGPASQLEKQFKLRYFTLVKEGELARIIYFKTNKKDRSKPTGGPIGSMDIVTASFERLNKLDFELWNDKKRLYCRAFSEIIANDWEEALNAGGVSKDLEYDDE